MSWHPQHEGGYNLFLEKPNVKLPREYILNLLRCFFQALLLSNKQYKFLFISTKVYKHIQTWIYKRNKRMIDILVIPLFVISLNIDKKKIGKHTKISLSQA